MDVSGGGARVGSTFFAVPFVIRRTAPNTKIRLIGYTQHIIRLQSCHSIRTDVSFSFPFQTEWQLFFPERIDCSQYSVLFIWVVFLFSPMLMIVLTHARSSMLLKVHNSNDENHLVPFDCRKSVFCCVNFDACSINPLKTSYIIITLDSWLQLRH